MPERAFLALSGSERQRVERVDALTAAGSGSIAQLLDMLADTSWTVRRAVIASLAALGDAAARPLCELLRTRRDDEDRLAAAVDALVASVGDVETVIEPFAEDRNPAVAVDVAQVLGRRRRPRSIPTLVRLSQHANDNVAVTALEGLGRIGGRAAVDQLVAAVQSGSFFRTFPAIDVLGRSGDPRSVAPLAGLLEQLQYAFEAARALGRTGDRAAVKPLIGLLHRSGDAPVRLAAQALSDLRDRHGELYGTQEPIVEAILQADPERSSVRKLVQALSGADASEQAAICAVLGALGGEDSVGALTQLLDGAPAVAHAAAAELQRLGRAADPQLLRLLGEGDSARRLLLLPIVAHSKGLAEVIRCLDDPDPTVRVLACESLARIGSPLAAPPLFRLLADPNPAVVQAAIGAVQSLGSGDTERLALQAARSSSATVRQSALRILSYLGNTSAVPIFLDSLRDPDPRVRDAAVQGLAFLEDPRAKEALFAAIRDPSERTRASAARALGAGAPDARATACLLKALGDPAPWVRYYACQSLGKLRAEAAAPAVAELLADAAGQVRVAAVEALSHLESDSALEALRKAASSADPDVQRTALIGLGITRRREVLPVLLQATGVADESTRLVALSALAGFDAPSVAQALARAARDEDENVRAAALNFLAGHPGPEATRLLIGLLPSQPSAEAIVSALALPVAGRIEGILSALVNADDELSPHLTSALARMRSAAGDQALIDAMDLAGPPGRKAVAATLAALRSTASLAVLRRAAAADPDLEVRRICALLLAQ